VERQKKLPFRNHVWWNLKKTFLLGHLYFREFAAVESCFSNPNRAQSNLNGGSEEKNISNKQCFASCNCWCRIISKAVNIRLGYNFRRAEKLRVVDQRNLSGISAGFGLKTN
jgi:hypothetical protein